MNYVRKNTLGFAALLSPMLVSAQSLSDEMAGLHQVLELLYEEMMPLCNGLIGVAQGLAGFATLWFIASRVWRHLANVEPIDFYPLLRPFAIGLCIMIFPMVLAVINGVLKPTVTATGNMVEDSGRAIEVLLAQKEAAIRTTQAWQMYVGIDGWGDRDRWYRYTHDNQDPAEEGILSGIGNDIRFAMERYSYSFRNSVKEWMSEVLGVLFEAAALCIDTLRTFQLVVLSILGPLVFALSVFEGFHHTLTVWLARYINIFLWLPVANIFGSIIGKIQEKMLALDIEQVTDYGNTFFSRSDVAYLVFMIIGIIGYFTVPSVANYIVHAGGSALNQKVTRVFSTGARSATGGALAASGMAADAMGDAASRLYQSMEKHKKSSDYFNDQGAYMDNKIRGNP